MRRHVINLFMAGLLAAAPAAAAASQRTGSTRGAEPSGGSGGGAVPRGGSAEPGGSSGGVMPRSEPAPRTSGGSDRRGASDDSSTSERDRRTTGTGTSGRPRRGGVVYVPGGYGFYPWGFGGLGFGAYYGGYEDPWDYDAGYGAYGGRYGAYQSDDSGAMRLIVKPREAQVYVDGYYAGVVDDFDGIFQRLHLEPGPHRLEVRAPGYATLSLDVQITPGQTIKYEGDLAPAP